MDEQALGPLPRFNTIGLAEKYTVSKALKEPLSGYLGGVPTGGYWVERLQSEWCDVFQCKYAVACNSATSGLLAACMAIGIGPGDTVWTTALSMSATAACAKVLGADIVFIDVETVRYSMNMNLLHGPIPKCIIVTNLFGHPAYLGAMRSWCDSNNVIMIEDNAQSPFAKENGKYAGTVGHIGVFSLNVHKHIQTGEGGIVVSDNNNIAENISGAINHGELVSYAGDKNKNQMVGLNLRMTEPVAAIAVAQLAKGPQIIENRIEFALELTEMFKDAYWLATPRSDLGCKHVYYAWAARVTNGKRMQLVNSLRAYGFPMSIGYRPLNRIFHIPNEYAPNKKKHAHHQMKHQSCPVAESMDDKELILFEVCRYDPTKKQRQHMAEIAKRVVNENS